MRRVARLGRSVSNLSPCRIRAVLTPGSRGATVREKGECVEHSSRRPHKPIERKCRMVQAGREKALV